MHFKSVLHLPSGCHSPPEIHSFVICSLREIVNSVGPLKVMRPELSRNPFDVAEAKRDLWLLISVSVLFGQKDSRELADSKSKAEVCNKEVSITHYSDMYSMPDLPVPHQQFQIVCLLQHAQETQ